MMNVDLASIVIDFSERGPLFKPATNEDGCNFANRVECFDEALAMAQLRDDETLEPNFRCLRPVFIQNETRIRDLIYSCVDWREISEWETTAFVRIENAVNRVPEQYRQTMDDVLAHLAMCCLSRLVIGLDPFFERIFAAYECGLWPCGWVDAGSDSDVVVFVPLVRCCSGRDSSGTTR